MWIYAIFRSDLNTPKPTLKSITPNHLIKNDLKKKHDTMSPQLNELELNKLFNVHSKINPKISFHKKLITNLL